MMIRLLLNCAFTLLWLLLWQSSSFLNGVLGFVISALIITLASRVIGSVQPPEQTTPTTVQRPGVPVVGYALRLVNVLRFLVFFLYILVKANLDVAWEIITPGFRMKPRMLRYPVAGLTRAQVTTLANAITLTPGTLSADIDEAGENLYIHAMYAERRGDAIADLDALRHRLLWLVFARRPDETPQDTPPTP